MRLLSNRTGLLLALLCILMLAAAQDFPKISDSAAKTKGGNDAKAGSKGKTSAAAFSAEESKAPETKGAKTKGAKTDAANTKSASDAAQTSGGDGAITISANPTKTNGGGGGITNAPTVSAGDGAIPTYPAATVPPTNEAPFMRTSRLPSGTVFIAVGAIIGFAFAIMLVWRGLVAWSLHRSMRQARHGYFNPARKYKGAGESSTKLTTPFHAQGVGSAMSLDPLPGGVKPGAKPGPNAPVDRSSLFFSPTAGSGLPATGGNRASGYLPAGYYAAGASAPGGNNNNNSNRPISMADFGRTRPQSTGYQRAPQTSTATPPLTPDLRASNIPYGQGGRDFSNSTLGANSQARAPSAFLDDMFESAVSDRGSMRHPS